MGAGGPPHRQLSAAARATMRCRFMASACRSAARTRSTATTSRGCKPLCDRYQPDSFSEHLAWSSHGGVLSERPPAAALHRGNACAGSATTWTQVQEALGRRMLLENPSTYVLFAQSTIPRPNSWPRSSRRTGCGLLLDVNNVFVLGDQPSHRPARLSGGLPARSGGRDPPRRPCRGGAALGAASDRRAWDAGRRSGLGRSTQRSSRAPARCPR